MMTGFCRFDSTFHPAPAHNGSIGSQATVDNLVPADQLFPFLFQNAFHTMDKVTLQFVFVLQVFHFHASLATRAFVPKTFETFVAPDMDVFIRKQGGYFCQDLVHKLESCIFADTERVFVFAVKLVADPDSRRCFHTRQIRIGDKCSQAMSRYVYFRDDAHVAFCSVCQHFLHVFLCVETSVGRFFSWLLWFALPPLSDTWSTPGANFRQAWQGFYLQTPSLIVGQVPVEYIHFVFCQLIDVFLHFLFGEPVTADVKHKSAPGKLRFVGDVGAGNRPVDTFLFPAAFYFGGKHLQ